MRRNLKIMATGAVVPNQCLSDTALDRELGLPPGSSFKKTGIRSRYLSTTETGAVLGAEACRAAIANAGCSWDDVDCLIAASATMDQALPYNAAMIHAELGLSAKRTATFDVGTSCLSFLTAMDVSASLLETGRYRRIMIVSADVSTFTTDRSNLQENGIFGDGAAACLVEKTAGNESSEILATDLITLSEGVDLCAIRAGGSRFHRRTPDSNGQVFFEMKPRPLFALVARELPGFIRRLLMKAEMTMDEIDLVVPHQASPVSLRHISKILKIPPAKLVDISVEFGNQIGASLPTAMHHGLKREGLVRGSKVLLLGSGAGVSIGGMVLIY